MINKRVTVEVTNLREHDKTYMRQYISFQRIYWNWLVEQERTKKKKNSQIVGEHKARIIAETASITDEEAARQAFEYVKKNNLWHKPKKKTKEFLADMAEIEGKEWVSSDNFSLSSLSIKYSEFTDAVKRVDSNNKKLKKGQAPEKVQFKKARDDKNGSVPVQVQAKDADGKMGKMPIRQLVDIENQRLWVAPLKKRAHPVTGEKRYTWVRYRDKGSVIQRAYDNNATVNIVRLMRQTKGGVEKWYITFDVAYEDVQPLTPCNHIVGLDMGISTPVYSSDGEEFLVREVAEIKELQRKKKRLERDASRKYHQFAKDNGYTNDSGGIKKGARVPKSNRRTKAYERIGKIDKRIADKRSDAIKKLCNYLTTKYQYVVIEDLSVKNMTKSAAGDSETPGKNVSAKSGMNREILNVGWYKIRQTLEGMIGDRLIVVDPKYTSQTCSECGSGSQGSNYRRGKSFTCGECGHEEDADLNAAKNIRKKGLTTLQESV